MLEFDPEVRCLPVTYKIDTEHQLVLSTAWGRFTLADAIAHKDKLLADPDFQPTYSQIADFTHVSEMALSADELRMFAKFNVFASRARRAFIAPGDEKFGLGRMFAVLRESHGETGIRVFRTIEDGMAWVQQEA